MKNRFIDIYRKDYKIQPNDFGGSKHSYIITKPDNYNDPFFSYKHSEISLLQPKDLLTVKNLKEIQYLKMGYFEDANSLSLDNIALQMENIAFLQIPFTYFLDYNSDLIFKNLQVLSITHTREYNHILKDNRKNIKSKKLLSNLSSESLRYLDIINLSGTKECIENYIEISAEQFPQLDYISFKTDKNGIFLNQIQNFVSLKHLTVIGAVTDIFPFIKSDLQSLKISGAGKAFTLNGITALNKLEAIYLDSVHSVIDCNLFLHCLELKEICIYNSSYVENIEAVLKLPNLRSLEIINCKMLISKSLQEQIKLLNLERLEIL